MSKNFFNSTRNFFTKKFNLGKTKEGKGRTVCTSTLLTIESVTRQRNMTDEARRRYATEQIDSFYGFSLPYLRGLIEKQIDNTTIQNEMKKLAVALPLLKRFISSISKVYAENPQRSFFIDDKQIVAELPSDISDETKFEENKELFDKLSSFYNKNVVTCIKEAEQLTNLLKTTIYKVVTDDTGEIKIKFIPNDTIQICQSAIDPNLANEIAFVRDDFADEGVIIRNTRIIEQWTADEKTIPVEQDGVVNQVNEEISDNEASKESKLLFDSKKIGSAFAPFVVFRESDPTNTFWNLKDADTFDFIKSINMNLTELRYLIKYSSFGLKYVVNGSMAKDSVLDPTGLISFTSAGRTPGDSDNIQVGEFENSGRIKEVIEAIIFNLKMMYDSFNLPFDSLISSNSVRSAENKLLDNENLFAHVNSQRDIWAVNEESLFKVMQSVYNRDNTDKIPKGVELRVNYEEQRTQEKTQEEWMVEIQNNVSSVIDWIGAENPDLNKDELLRLFENNILVNALSSADEEGDEFEEGEEKKREEKGGNTNNNKEKKNDK